MTTEPLAAGSLHRRSFCPNCQGAEVATNRLDFAVNTLPKSILMFCAHEDDDTAHPEIIRAAVENNIPCTWCISQAVMQAAAIDTTCTRAMRSAPWTSEKFE